MKRSIPAISVVAGTLLLVPLLGGCVLLGGERYLVSCADVTTEMCDQAERAAADFHRTSDERIESIQVNEDGSIAICTASGCVWGTPAD